MGGRDKNGTEATMGLFNFLAVGSSLKGLVSRRAHQEVPLAAAIPNFSLRPGVAERLRENFENRRGGDPFARRDPVRERELRERLQQHSGPRVRSTYRPENFGQAPPRYGESWPAQPPGVAPQKISQQPLQPEVGPSSRSIVEPSVGGGAGSFVRKLKMARRVVQRPRGGGIKRQPKRPSFYRDARGNRTRRAPRGVSAKM